MIIVIFLTITLFGYYIYMNKQINTHVIPIRKINMGYLPKTSHYQFLSISEPTRYASYLQMTNNRKIFHKCHSKQPNLELCTESPSDKIETNIQYTQEPYILY
jgi:hypothetical protein